VKSPVIIATVGTFSGPVGNVLLPVLNGAQIWTKHINSRGGLNGHPVNLVVYDDAGDPARHRSQVQDAVERRKAIAFLANPETLAGRQSVEYINQKRVPVVGDGGGMSWVYESPMYFTQQSNGDAMFYSFIASPADINVPKGKKKLGTLVCVEAPDCDPADKIMSGAAKRLGFEHVYRGRASVAQPDYTAECLSARNGGVEVFLVLLDRLSLGRVAAACARQGFRPTFAHVATAQGDDSKKDPNLEGLSASSNVFPYFQSGTPASDEFQAALRSYSGAVSLGIGTATGWTAGKLLEKAAAKLPEPPTSQAILEGLWSIKNDDLGGLTLPLTFQESGPTKPTSTCWFNMVVRKSEWTTPDGYRLRCVSMT
jgi:branched-chain amino acid transport system substrate-binding protein